MRKIALYFFFLTYIACSENNNTQQSAKQKQAFYFIDGAINDYNSFQVFLYKNTHGILKKTDSFLIKNNQFQFQGNIPYPERAFLVFEKKTGHIPIVLSGDSLFVKVFIKDIKTSTIKGSALTTELQKVEAQSAEIFNEIDYLYPQFQKARLENNIEQLKEISKEIKKIEVKNNTFLIDYASKNPTSYVAAMVLYDVLQKDTVYNPKIENIYTAFSSEVKKGKDAKAIAAKITNLKN